MSELKKVNFIYFFIKKLFFGIKIDINSMKNHFLDYLVKFWL